MDVDANTYYLNRYLDEIDRREKEAEIHKDYRMRVAKDDIPSDDEKRQMFLDSLGVRDDLVEDLIGYAFEKLFMTHSSKQFAEGTYERKILEVFEYELDEMAEDLVDDGEYDDYRIDD